MVTLGTGAAMVGGLLLLVPGTLARLRPGEAERAPLAATPDMYLDAHGDVIPGASIDGPLSAGIPGTPAALAHIAFAGQDRAGFIELGKSRRQVEQIAAQQVR